jgi:folate-binding Fe-S cluster repair protein YgfZ
MLASTLRSFSTRPLGACTCRRAAFSSSSISLAPPFVYTALPERALLAIGGVDSVKFLQGLVSNDVRRLEGAQGEAERLLYAGVLKADVSFA